MNKPLVILAATTVLLLLSACEKDRLDAQVKELCAKDGGIKVYETVKLPPEKFDKYGVVRIPFKQDAKPEDEYYYEWKVHIYVEGNPSLRRDHFLVIRKSDSKLLGEAISYARRGGDMPGPWHPSSFRCPEDSGNSILHQRVFIKAD
ncbi:MAG: hypothetical protein KF853_09530 [Rhodocyclaceae bacterium]|nr:hypothetical protein [Rhodocyclaceae bacterium]